MQIADSLIQSETLEIVLTGGEPLLRRDLIYPLAKKYTKNGVHVGLNSNLVKITNEDCHDILTSGISGVLGSLSSHKEGIYNQITQTNNYSNVVRGIKLLVEYEIPLALNMVVIQSNKDHVYETGKFAHSLGVKAFCATPASPSKFLSPKEELSVSDIISTLDDLLRLKNDLGMNVDIVEPLPRCLFSDPLRYEHFLKRDCGAGKTTVVISSSGKIRPCTHVPLEYGNILRDGIKGPWIQMQEWRDGNFTPEECSPCDELSICSLGCREASQLKCGKYNQLDPWSNPNNVGERKFVSDRVEVQGNEEYHVTKEIRFREESDSQRLVLDPQSRSMALLNEDFFSFLLLLNKRQTFNVGEIINEFGPRALNLINYLKSKNLIKLQEVKK